MHRTFNAEVGSSSLPGPTAGVVEKRYFARIHRPEVRILLPHFMGIAQSVRAMNRTLFDLLPCYGNIVQWQNGCLLSKGLDVRIILFPQNVSTATPESRNGL